MNVALFLEMKNEYTEHLCDVLTPYIYEGLTSIYKEAVKSAKSTDNNDKILLIFQKLLQGIDKWNQVTINDETNRIKHQSGTSEYLEDLIKAVIKSNILLLTYSNTISNIIGQNFYHTFRAPILIHHCYIECGKYSHNNPYLFFHDTDSMDYKRNQLIIQSKIKEGITRAIRKVLPISLILKEFLVNTANFIVENQCQYNGPYQNQIELVNDNDPKKLPILNEKLDKNTPIQSPIYPNVNNANVINTNNVNNINNKINEMIITEGNKTEGEKIQALMHIDKLISNMNPMINSASSPNHLNNKQNSRENSLMSNYSRQSSGIPDPVFPGFLKDDYGSDASDYTDDFMNNRLKEDENSKKILNIKYDDEPTKTFSGSGINTNKRTVNATTITNNNIYKQNSFPTIADNNNLCETSERVDPFKVNLIEDYGQVKNTLNKQFVSRNRML